MKKLLLILLLLPGIARAQYFNGTGAPSANGVNAATVTCGSSSTPFTVTGNNYLSIQTPIGGSQVCFAWGPSATATTSPPSQCYAAGTNIAWGGGTGACIVATGSQAISVATGK
jgi:hypothetical protein